MTCREAFIERTLGLIRAVSIEEEDGANHRSHTTTLGYLSDLTLSFLFPSSSTMTRGSPFNKKKRSGINIQHCPNCDLAYSVPINCFHVICEPHLGGCGIEFCFLCSAIRSPILAHGNMMHRYSCPFNIDQYCCPENCLKNHQKKCREMQWSSQCSECLKNEEGEVCSFPLATNDQMNPSGKHWKILNLTDVQRELEIIQGKQGENS